MKSTVKEIAAVDEHSASKLLSMAARGALKGARGNSGVILSQILRGFARGHRRGGNHRRGDFRQGPRIRREDGV